MKTKLLPTPLRGLYMVEIDYFKDERGFFIESWHKRDFADAGIDVDFVQDGHSGSKGNVIRGMHYQDMTAPMAKLVRCTIGKIFEVAIDLRINSPTFGKWFGIEISADDKKQLFLPVGFAQGFCAMSDYVEVQYKMSGFHTPSAEKSILWNDQDIGIKWPTQKPILSTRDQDAITLKEYLTDPSFK